LGSAGGALIDFVIALVLLRNGADGWLALAIAMSVSASAVYLLHQKVTFADLGTRELSWSRFTFFVINTGFVYLIRVAVFEILNTAGNGLTLSLGVALVSSLLINFGISRWLIFSGGNRKQ
jgi:putative flippase GtrA